MLYPVGADLWILLRSRTFDCCRWILYGAVLYDVLLAFGLPQRRGGAALVLFMPIFVDESNIFSIISNKKNMKNNIIIMLNLKIINISTCHCFAAAVAYTVAASGDNCWWIPCAGWHYHLGLRGRLHKRRRVNHWSCHHRSCERICGWNRRIKIEKDK